MPRRRNVFQALAAYLVFIAVVGSLCVVAILA